MSLEATDCFLLLDTTKLTLGNEPALAAHGAENPALGYLFAEAAEQLILRFIRTKIYRCQPVHLLSA